MVHLMLECGRMHEDCPGTCPCSLCDIMWPPRDDFTGKFVSWEIAYAMMAGKMSFKEVLK